MECEVPDHRSDITDHIRFLPLDQEDPTDLACHQEVPWDHQVLWWWVHLGHIHVDPQDPWCVVTCQAHMVPPWGCRQGCGRGCLQESLIYHPTCGLTGAGEGGQESHHLNGNQARKDPVLRQRKARLSNKQSKTHFDVFDLEFRAEPETNNRMAKGITNLSDLWGSFSLQMTWISYGLRLNRN